MIVEALHRMAGLTFDGTNPRDPAIKELLGLGQKSTAGVDVSSQKVMGIPAVKRAIQIITDKIYGMPWYVFREQEDGREYDKQHPSWMCVSSQANEELDDARLRQILTQYAMLHGNGCAYIERPNGWPNSGEVRLYPLLPDRTKLRRVSERAATAVGDAYLAGQLRYETRIGGQTYSFPETDVLHIRGYGNNAFWGSDLLELMLDAFGGVLAKEDFGNRFFGQGATPAGFIETTGGLDEEAEETFIESLRRSMHGLGSSHKMILLEENMKFHPITIDPQKSQMLEGRQFDVRQIAMIMGIKAHKLIDSANSAFASLEQANQEHRDDDVMPWVNKWRKEYRRKLLSEEQVRSGSHSIDVDDEFLEWVPFRERSSGVVELYNNGLIDKDEGRRKVNFGPSRTSRAKQFRIPSNIVYEDDMAVVPVANTPPGDVETPEDDSDGQTADRESEVIEYFRSKTMTRLTKTSKAKARQGARVFLSWLDGLKVDRVPTVAQKTVDSVFDEFRNAANLAASSATTDEELRSKIDEIWNG